MPKKLALWALLLQDNEFFILDEPFNGVDFETAFFMKHKLLELKKQQKTIILSSHILSSLTEIADEIFVLDNQHISQTYTPSQFSTLEQAMYDKIVGVKII